MKLISLFLTIIIFLLMACNPASDSSDEQTKMLQQFYERYIFECVNMTAKKDETALKTFCMDNLISKLTKEQLDYDPFLNAQDCDIEWLKTLSIIQENRHSNVYFVSYTYTYDDKINTGSIKLQVVKEQDGYKIGAIL
ncbi:MAG: DUF3828 domain-containing protein [Cytophagales bacterium]|nr:DUF3828 domain-containing protein [Cytophaga sp.]